MKAAVEAPKSGTNTGDGRVSGGRAVPFSTVQAREEDQIRSRRKALGCPEYTDDGLVGLAISGGGIRSATFSLGIIQKLAESRILKHVDYISTVSGGGYIGSWLYSWIRRRQAEFQPQKAVAPFGEVPPNSEAAFEDVCKALNPTLHSPAEPEPQELTFLRQYSNYLTPRVSVFNADTWMVAAIWSRNTLLNLAILVAAFGSAVLLARLAGIIAGRYCFTSAEFGAALITSAGLLIPMVGLICLNLARISKITFQRTPPTECERRYEQSDTWVIYFCIFPLLSAISYSFWLDRAHVLFVEGTLLDGVRANTVVLFVAYFILQMCSGMHGCFIRRKKREIAGDKKIETPQKINETATEDEPASLGSHAWNWAMGILWPAAAAFVTAALLRAIAFIFDLRHGKPDETWFVLTWGPPLVLVAFAIGVIAHIGLMGRDLPEASREWLGRLRAWLMIFSMFWLIIFGVAIYGPWLLALIGVKSSTAIAGLGSGWILTTAAGLLAGKSGKTSGKDQDTAKSGERSTLMEIFARLGPYLFIAGFSIAVALGVHVILTHALDVSVPPPPASQVEKYNVQVRNDNIQLSREVVRDKDEGFQRMLRIYWPSLTATELVVQDANKRWALSGLAALLGLLLIAGAVLAWRVDINQFSMHNFYKDRLVRCYLGASRQGRRAPNPFTGFDDFDDTPLHEFTDDGKYFGPYPIVNAALNVTSGGKLQYQERQAQSYIFTPLYTGYNAENAVDEMRLSDSSREHWTHSSGAGSPGTGSSGTGSSGTGSPEPASLGTGSPGTGSPPCAYRPTELTGGGIKVGMAVATSGAAVNPNMGYHTSTTVSFLLTVFNVRLGWWLGNTLKADAFRKPGPLFGLLYSFRELLGMANADSSYVNLSDGGHFENMGIYELVRRQCRYIICCDGEQDSGPTFGGIGNAIRKCRTDFGVEIDLPLGRLRKVDGFSRVHCAVGKIKYRDYRGDGSAHGYIVYLKSSLTGDEPTDVLAYHSDQPDFPQQTTGDQWFDESQFESYRRLGYHVADKAFSSGDNEDLKKGNLRKFFDDLYQVWFPPSPAVDRASAAHSDIYARILEAVRQDRKLADIDPALFVGFDREVWDHESGHICNSLIQLMERVFYDLNLEDREEQSHPYVQGWIGIFKHWTRQEAFKKAWQVTSDSYPVRFRKFYDSLAAKKRDH